MSRSRRSLLAALAGTLGGLAGCQSRPPSREPFDVPERATDGVTVETSTPRTTPAPTQIRVPEDAGAGPAPSCPGAVRPLNPGWVVVDEPLQGLFLYTASDTVAPGETVTVTLRNFSNDPSRTDSRVAFDLQRAGSDGWHTVFGLDPRTEAGPTRGETHDPGVAFTWAFPFTPAGVGDLAATAGYAVCGPVSVGRYRFVYHGVTPDAESARSPGTEYAVGTRFTVASGDRFD